MRQALSAILAGVSMLGATALAEDVERIAAPLDQLYPHWDTYLGIEAERRSHFTLAYVLSSERTASPDEVELWYEHDGRRHELAPGPDGRLAHLPSLEALESAPDVWVNQEGGGMSLSMTFALSLAPSERYAQDDLLLALSQANEAVREVAGVAALFAPNLKSLNFYFEGSAPEAWAVHENGERTALDVSENLAVYRPRQRGNRSVTHLEFGAPPVRVMLDS
ncbi:hypothetical protein [Maricaulis sp. CAU 1757]